MVLNYLGMKISEEKLAIMANTQPKPIGTRLTDMVDTLKKLNFETYSSIEAERDNNGLCFPTYSQFRNFVVENIKAHNPIIVENVDYGGHYKVIIGIDLQNKNSEQDMLIFADPYDKFDGDLDGYNYCPADKFYEMWFDDHCLEKKYKKQAFIIVKRKQETEKVTQ